MPKAVRFENYGGIDVLKIEDVPRPVPGEGQVLVQVKAAGINPGEAKIREGLLHARWPATFPSGQGSDLAGVVAETGPGVTGFSAGDEVIGWTDNRASQAEYVVAEAGQPDRQAGRGAVGGGRGPVRGRGHRVRGGAGGRPEPRRHGRGGRRGGRGRLDRGPAGPAGRGDGDRAGQRAAPRVAHRARGDPGQLRRRGGRPDPAGRRPGRRVHRHVRRGLRPAGRGGSGRGALPGGHDRQLRAPSRSTGSRPRAAPPGPAPRCWPNWPG